MTTKIKFILRVLFSCLSLTIGIMCFTYMMIFIENIQWYLLGLCISGGVIGITSAIANTVMLIE